MNEQQDILVQTPAGIASFPAGTDPRVIERALAEQFPSPTASHEPAERDATKQAAKRPEQTLAESEPDYMGNDPNLGKRALDNAPAVGALAATTMGPAGFLPSVGMAILGGTTGAVVRGDSLTKAVTEGGKQGAYSIAGGLAGKGIVRGGRWVASKADPLIQSAVKPAISELRRMAGQAGTSMGAEAKRISGIIRRTGIRTPEQAEAGIKAAEERVQKALASVGPDAETVTILTDAPQRAGRYLGKLERSASRQMSPGDDVATVAGERAQFERTSPLFQNVQTQVAKEVPSAILDESGRPMMRISHETVSSRVPRANVTAGESMELARGTSRHATRKAFGEQKSMSVEAQKALDRAGRDSAKAAAPESMRADLRTEGELIRLKPILDRMMVREGSRDALSLPGIVGAAPSIAHGKVPVLGMLAQWMRNNQLRTGLGADRVGRSMMRGGQSTAQIMAELVRLAQLAQLRDEQ